VIERQLAMVFEKGADRELRRKVARQSRERRQRQPRLVQPRHRNKFEEGRPTERSNAFAEAAALRRLAQRRRISWPSACLSLNSIRVDRARSVTHRSHGNSFPA